MPGRRWTEHEDAAMRLHYPTGPVAVARMLGRSSRAVYQRACVLGLVGRLPSTWTEQDERLLVENYARMGPTKLAAMLGRTFPSVQTRARDLGLAMYRKPHPTTSKRLSPRVWTEAAVDYLRSQWGSAPLTEIAAHVGTTEVGVRRKAERLGLQFGPRGRRRRT